MKGEVDPQDGLDPQSGQLSKPELDISLLQTESMMTEHVFTKGPSTQSSYTEPTYTEMP